MFQVKGLEKIQFHEARLQDVSTSLSTGVNVTGNVCSKASPEEEAHVLRVERALIRTSLLSEPVLLKMPGFQSYNSPVDMHSITHK